MLGSIKNTWLGMALIALASGLLLLSDLDRRHAASKESRGSAMPRLAVMQWGSTDLLDSTVAGIVDGLHHQGFEDGRTATIRFFNAAGDTTTANLMAREVTGGAYDMVLTASTLALQAVAGANRERQVPHVFGGVTDPYGAGVGITGPEPDQHPHYLTGVGTFQPVAGAFRIAHQMNPQVTRIGTVWNPAEDNSEACLRKARAVCQELGIELIEANAGNTSEVAEAARAVVSRNAEALWIGGDTVAIAAINTIVAVARTADIPVFSNDPNDVRREVLFGLGASYEQVGFTVGDMGGRILRGADPASFGVKNLVPEVLTLNESLAEELSGWEIRAEHRAMARDSVARTAARQRGPEPGRMYTVGLLYFGPNPVFEMAAEGVRDALHAAGFEEGRNLTIHATHANNDISMLPQIVQRLMNRQPDVLIPLSTPCLAAVLAKVQHIPVVFGIVSAPLEVGAGDSFENHLPHVTGAVWTAPTPEAFVWMKRLFPKAGKLGILHNPAHAKSRVEALGIRELCKKHGLTVEERTISSSSEIAEAMQALLQTSPDIVFGMGENTVVSGFAAVTHACLREKVPLVAADNSLMGNGALFSIGGSPRLEGQHTGQIAARVLLGENPAGIPFAPSTEIETAIDFAAARHLGIEFPPALLKKTDIFHNMGSRYQRPMHIAMVTLVQNRVLDLAEAGVLRGLRESGLNEGTDFVVRRYNAQGEITQLPALLDAARNRDPDVIVTITTPAMMAAAKRIADVPIVFSVASDPVALGIFPAGGIPAHITGVHDDPPLDRLLDMAMHYDPALKSVGIVFDPGQPNAVLSVEKLRQACGPRNVMLHEATASTLTELAPAVQAIVQRKAGALLLSADNVVSTGFSVIQGIAATAKLPIFVTDVNLVEEGATGAVGDDYEAWGVQSGRLTAKVLAGVPPAALPLQSTRVRQVMAPHTADLPGGHSLREHKNRNVGR